MINKKHQKSVKKMNFFKNHINYEIIFAKRSSFKACISAKYKYFRTKIFSNLKNN